jgi:hypothetical protein
MAVARFAVLAALLGSSALTVACTAGEVEDEPAGVSEDALSHSRDNQYFYTGPLPSLQNARVFLSLRGHTVRVSGTLPDGISPEDAERIRELPHLRIGSDGRQVDIVYPIATAASAGQNPRPGTNSFHRAFPYRPHDTSYNNSNTTPRTFTWGGFPFVGYGGGYLGFHGPITDEVNDDGQKVWYLQRGPVSAGCSRMVGEHVVEFTHLVGINMRKAYRNRWDVVANRVWRPGPGTVQVLGDYDTWNGKYVDVDYPTHGSARRPSGDVEMFGSWLASETPEGVDLERRKKWEGGVPGVMYDPATHVVPGMLCSFVAHRRGASEAEKNNFVLNRRLISLIDALPRQELPRDICAKKACVVDGLESNLPAASIIASCRLDRVNQNP